MLNANKLVGNISDFLSNDDQPFFSVIVLFTDEANFSTHSVISFDNNH